MLRRRLLNAGHKTEARQAFQFQAESKAMLMIDEKKGKLFPLHQQRFGRISTLPGS
jgi:hypothetical protein